MDKRVQVALINTLDRFERGHWLRGRWSDGKGNYCLLGSLEHELKIRRGAWTSDLREALAQMGFTGSSAYGNAYAFNDTAGRESVVILLRSALKVKQSDSMFMRLHHALAASRRAHAERDIGKKVPNVVPAAWEEVRESENGVHAAMGSDPVGKGLDTVHL